MKCCLFPGAWVKGPQQRSWSRGTFFKVRLTFPLLFMCISDPCIERWRSTLYHASFLSWDSDSSSDCRYNTSSVITSLPLISVVPPWLIIKAYSSLKSFSACRLHIRTTSAVVSMWSPDGKETIKLKYFVQCYWCFHAHTKTSSFWLGKAHIKKAWESKELHGQPEL